MKRRTRTYSALLLLVLILPAILVSVTAFVRPTVTESVENLFLSYHVKNTVLPSVNQKIVMVLGGDDSISRVGEWPWERSVHAELINSRLYKAKTVALDIMFVDASLLGGDDKLAQAMEQHGSVVLAYTEDEIGKSTVFNNELLYDASAGEGFSNGYQDPDGVTRRYRFMVEKDNGLIAPSFACAVLMAAGYSPDWSFNADGSCKLTVTAPDGIKSFITLDKNYEFIRFPAPKEQYETYEYSDVLEGKVSPDVFEDAIVIVGFNAIGAADLLTTVTGLEYGAVCQLDSIYTLLTGINPPRVPVLPDALTALALYIICIFLVRRFNSRFAFVIPLAMCALWLALSFILFKSNIIWLSALPQLAAIILAFLSEVYYKSIREAEKRSEMFYNLLTCMISAVDAKDPITSGHSQRVALLSERIAKRMGLPAEAVSNIHLAGLIHDIGKIGIPDSILGKQGPLSSAEFKEMQSHPKTGGVIMEAVSLQPEILDGVLYHHERPDGRGYPYGISDLSVTAKIIKVADVFDALNTERQYKKAWPIERTLNMLYAGRETEFDSGVVDALIEDVAPPGWKPSEERRTGGGLSKFVVEKCGGYAVKLLDSAIPPASGEADIQPEYICRDAFCGFEWYSAYYRGTFLEQKPALADSARDEAYFALKSGEGHILYYFLRGFLTMGAYTGIDTTEARSAVSGAYGEPASSFEDFDCWDAGRMLIFINGTRMAYVMKSILEE